MHLLDTYSAWVKMERPTKAFPDYKNRLVLKIR